MTLTRLILGLLATVLLVGCFTCESPFYETTQITQDSRILGEYKNESDESKDESLWQITRSEQYPEKYKVTVKDHSASVELLATLFRVDTNLFIDLYPLTDSGVYTPGDVPSVSQYIRTAMYEPRHVLWKVEVSDTGIKYSFPVGNAINSALKQAPELRTGVTASGKIELPNSTKEAQKYLRQFVSDPSVFNHDGSLTKK